MSAKRKPSNSSIEEVAWRIAGAHTHGLSQFRLLKLLWLAELRYAEAYGERLTDAGWWRWDYGPYSKDVINKVRAGRKSFQIVRDATASPMGGLVIVAKSASPGKTLSVRAVEILEDVIDMYKAYGTGELRAEVYADPFFENTPHGDDFDFGSLARYRRQMPESKAERLLDLPTRPVESIDALFG